jgi:hypothetical protein
VPASVDFQVGTGRMPAKELGAQIQAKPQFFNDEQISALAAYVASLGPGPAIPSDKDLDYSNSEHRRGRRDLPHQLRHVPQLRRLRRRTHPWQVRTLAEEDHTPAHVRGDADRAAVDARVR